MRKRWWAEVADKAKKSDGRKSLLVLFIGLVLVGVAVCGLFLLRNHLLTRNAQEETRRYLTEVSRHMAESVNRQVEASFMILETTAEAYADLPPGKEANEYLQTVAQRNGFLRMGVVTPEGHLTTTDGQELDIDLEEQLDIKGVMEGAERTIDLVTTPLTGEKTVACGMPIRRNGKIIGVLTASTAQTVLAGYLGVDSFGGAGFSNIITAGGDIIVDTGRESSGLYSGNFFAELEEGTVKSGDTPETMRRRIAERETGMLGYVRPDGEYLSVVYMPLDVADWYLLSMVPYDVASEGVQRYISLTGLVDAVVIILFLLLIFVVTRIFWRGEKRMERLAFVDGVTGGANRTAFERRAAELLAAAPAESYAVVSMDLQGFKLINESFGSENGNRTLAHVYGVIAEQLETGELAGRMSDDIFSLLLRYTTRRAMEERMERLGESVNRFNLGRSEKERYYLPVFQGVYVVEDPDQEIVAIQDRANVARKSNKHTRLGWLNTCTFYDDLYQEQLRREKEIDNRVESALKNGEFVIYLQPKVELRWNMVAGAEALVRWQDPERGLIQPDEFIPLFERSGFIVKLDRYVFERVCMLQREWLDAGRKPTVISLNVSRSSVAAPDFVDEYIRMKEQYRIPDGLLELELTETLFLENENMLLALMERIQNAGFVCALDDFGSGYSTLNLLRVIPADVLKLDKVFFDTPERDARGEYVIQSVLELARRLKMQTVCEGVESPAQLHFLRRFPCDLVQGFVFSGPVPVEEFEGLAFSGRPLTPKEMKTLVHS